MCSSAWGTPGIYSILVGINFAALVFVNVESKGRHEDPYNKGPIRLFTPGEHISAQAARVMVSQSSILCGCAVWYSLYQLFFVRKDFHILTWGYIRALSDHLSCFGGESRYIDQSAAVGATLLSQEKTRTATERAGSGRWGDGVKIPVWACPLKGVLACCCRCASVPVARNHSINPEQISRKHHGCSNKLQEMRRDSCQSAWM